MTISKNVKLLSYFNFFTDFNLYAPVAIIYFTRVSGSFTLGMSIFSIVMISSALFEVPTGIFSDFIGRKKTLILGAFSSIIFAIFYALGSFYWILVFGAVFEGLTRALYSGNNKALLYDSLKQSNQEKEYSHFLGRTSSMFQFALAISAVLGSVLANYSFSLLMWLSVVPKIVCLLIGFKIQDVESYTQESANIFSHTLKAFKLFAKNINLRLLSLVSIIGYAFGEASYQFRSAFVNTLWPLWAVGASKALSNIGAALSFYFSGKLIKRFHEFRLLFFSKLYSLFINIISIAHPTVLSPALISTTSLTYGASYVAKDALFQKEFTHKQRATMSSLNSLFGSIAFGIVSILLGFFADKLGPGKALLIMQAAGFVSLGIYFKLFKKYNDN